jgi:Tetratricopeptide repeat
LASQCTSTLSTVNNLGALYADQGKMDEAERMYQRALQGKEKAWGPEHGFETSSTATAKMIQHAPTDCSDLDPLRNKLETHFKPSALGAIEQAAANIEALFRRGFEDGWSSRG